MTIHDLICPVLHTMLDNIILDAFYLLYAMQLLSINNINNDNYIYNSLHYKFG